MVQIDSAWEDDSNGGHVVDFVKIWIWMWNSGWKAESESAGVFLTPFLTETIYKKSSNQADYMPNR